MCYCVNLENIEKYKNKIKIAYNSVSPDVTTLDIAKFFSNERKLRKVRRDGPMVTGGKELITKQYI